MHPFPIAPRATRPPRTDPGRRPDRIEGALVAGLVLTTALQMLLCALAWIG